MPTPGAVAFSGLRDFRAEAPANLGPGEERERRRPQNKGTAPDASALGIVRDGSVDVAPENVKSCRKGAGECRAVSAAWYTPIPT